MESKKAKSQPNLLEQWIKDSVNIKRHVQEFVAVDLNRKQLFVQKLVERQCQLTNHELKERPLRLICVGHAGTGKTAVIKSLVNHLEQIKKGREGFDYAVVAPTASAAIQINGDTIHSRFGLSKYSGDLYEAKRNIKPKSKAMKYAKNLKFLIVDEVSMLGLSLFYFMDIFCRSLDEKYKDVPFGNISVILVGDFWQLSPVKDKPLFTNPAQLDHPLAQVAASVYRGFESVIFLDEPMRHAGNDPRQEQYRQFLFRLSRRSLTTDDLDLVSSRQLTSLSLTEQSKFEDAIHIYPYNTDVAAFNRTCMKKLDSPIVTIPTINVPSETIEICIGSQVVLLRNIWKAQGLVNGSLGKVVDIVFNECEAKIINKNEDTEVEWNFTKMKKVRADYPFFVLIEFEKYSHHLVVKTNLGQGVPIFPITESHDRIVNGKYPIITWLPIKPAYALSIHKAQSATFSKAVVRLTDYEFTSGLNFVAASRTKKLEDVAFEYDGLKRLVNTTIPPHFTDQQNEDDRLTNLATIFERNF